jgi:hypothetical protein
MKSSLRITTDYAPFINPIRACVCSDCSQDFISLRSSAPQAVPRTKQLFMRPVHKALLLFTSWKFTRTSAAA